MTFTCVDKLRDNSGNIKLYVLKDTHGTLYRLDRIETIGLLKGNKDSITNLKLSSDGKIINKDEKVHNFTLFDYETLSLIGRNIENNENFRRTFADELLNNMIDVKQVYNKYKALLEDELTREIYNRLHLCSNDVELLGVYFTNFSRVKGYKIKNNGNTDIIYEKHKYNFSGQHHQYVTKDKDYVEKCIIKPGETGLINPIDAIHLIVRPEYTGLWKNTSLMYNHTFGGESMIHEIYKTYKLNTYGIPQLKDKEGYDELSKNVIYSYEIEIQKEKESNNRNFWSKFLNRK